MRAEVLQIDSRTGFWRLAMTEPALFAQGEGDVIREGGVHRLSFEGPLGMLDATFGPDGTGSVQAVLGGSSLTFVDSQAGGCRPIVPPVTVLDPPQPIVEDIGKVLEIVTGTRTAAQGTALLGAALVADGSTRWIEFFSGELGANGAIGHPHNFVLPGSTGGDWFGLALAQQTSGDVEMGAIDGTDFVNDRWRLNENWGFNTGPRYDHVAGPSPVPGGPHTAGEIFPGMGNDFIFVTQGLDGFFDRSRLRETLSGTFLFDPLTELSGGPYSNAFFGGLQPAASFSTLLAQNDTGGVFFFTGLAAPNPPRFLVGAAAIDEAGPVREPCMATDLTGRTIAVAVDGEQEGLIGWRYDPTQLGLSALDLGEIPGESEGFLDISCDFFGGSFLYSHFLDGSLLVGKVVDPFGPTPQTDLHLDASSFFNTGSLSHELKFGAGYRQTEVRSFSSWGGIVARYDHAASPRSTRATAPFLGFLPIGILPEPPAGPWLSSPLLPGHRVKVRITGGGGPIAGRLESDCIEETLCVSGALAGRPEVFVRVVGPKPNGHLWPTYVKFSTSQVEIWNHQEATGVVTYHLLPAVAEGGERLALSGVADRGGFLPPLARTHGAAAVVAAAGLDHEPAGGLDLGGSIGETSGVAARAAGDPPPPEGAWLTSARLPGYRVKVRIAGGGGSIPGRAEPDCIAETLCASGALPGRSEVFVRVVGPKPNGRLWPTLVKFSTSQIEVWIEQTKSGEIAYYLLEPVASGGDLLTLDGLADKSGFAP